jgi:hypothetical protein
MEQASHEHRGLVRGCRAVFLKTRSIETVIACLRECGQDKGQSIRVLQEALGLNNPQAKWLVHMSDTWRERRESDEALHRMAERVAREMSSSAPRKRRKRPTKRR